MTEEQIPDQQTPPAVDVTEGESPAVDVTEGESPAGQVAEGGSEAARRRPFGAGLKGVLSGRALKEYLRLFGLWLWFGLLGWGVWAVLLAGPLVGFAGMELSTSYLAAFGAIWLLTSVVLAEVSRRLIAVRRRLEPLQAFVRVTSSLMLLAIWVCVGRLVTMMVPELQEGSVVLALDRSMGVVWEALAELGTQVGLPSTLGGVWTGPILAFILFVLARNALHGIMSRVLAAEDRREEQVLAARARRQEGQEAEVLSRAQAAARRVAVSSYAEAKAILETTQLELTFVSLDIVGSTKMKEGEDPYVIDKAFSDYRKLVERQLRRHEAYKQTWTPDGQMAAFRNPQAAIDCAKKILLALDEFNESVSKVRSDFKLRIGANVGVVSTDDYTPMEEISDFSIDVAGHMQKYAETNTIWASGEVYHKLDNPAGFRQIERQVDGRTVYEWRPEDENQ